MSMCYHPHAFDAQRFAAVPTPADSLGICELLGECDLKEPDFGWSLDGTSDGDIISGRLPRRCSLVENVRGELESMDATGDRAEAVTLLGHVSEVHGRLMDLEPLIGYLLPDEMSRISAVLERVTFASPWVERDRLLLLQLFAIALASKCGLFWMYA